jgi:hypothetical protein
MSKYSNKEKKNLLLDINTLSKTEHDEIYRILLNENKITFSKNKNGVFFNLSNIDDDLFVKLENFVQYCMNNKKDLDDYDKKINECKLNGGHKYNNIIQLNLNNLPKDLMEESKEDWSTTVDSKSIQRLSNYIERIMDSKDKTCKRTNVKFNNAKKKYAKRVIQDKKFDAKVLKDLEIEDYLVKDGCQL